MKKTQVSSLFLGDTVTNATFFNDGSVSIIKYVWHAGRPNSVWLELTPDNARELFRAMDTGWQR